MQAAGHTDDGAQGDSSVGVKPSTANIIIFSHSYMIHLGFQFGVHIIIIIIFLNTRLELLQSAGLKLVKKSHSLMMKQ